MNYSLKPYKEIKITKIVKIEPIENKFFKQLKYGIFLSPFLIYFSNIFNLSNVNSINFETIINNINLKIFTKKIIYYRYIYYNLK